MHVEQISAQDATLEDMDRQGRASQAQADSALQNFREVSIGLMSPIGELCCQNGLNGTECLSEPCCL